MTTALVAGAVLAFLWLFQLTQSPAGLSVTPKPRGTYVTTVNLVIDTAGFGIGRSDTDMYKLALLAPTYAQLVTSEPVLQKAEARLGHPIDAAISAAPVESSPMVQLSVEGLESQQLASTATAVVDAFKDYVVENQQLGSVPTDLRIIVRGIGRPSSPRLMSNRRIELGVIVFCLPLAVALLLAYRLEHPRDESPPGIGV
jgi:capsular polysaccharide biosynthesis protein